MIEINLIPDVKQELIKAQRTRSLVIAGSIASSIIAGSVVVLLVLYIFGYQAVRNDFLDRGIKDGANDLSQVEDLPKMLTIQNQLKKIGELDNQKTVTSRMFDMLSAFTPAGDNAAQYSQVIINSDESTISLEGQTRAYDSMEVLRKTLENAMIEYADGDEAVVVNLATNISTGNVSFGEDASGQRVVRFNISFTYPPELFSSTIDRLTFRLSDNLRADGNVTDSYLGIPRTLFTQRAEDIEE
jgi:Tfp pilus assembly protein PilN